MAMAGESFGKNFEDCDGRLVGGIQRKVGLVYDERMCKHDTPDGEDHPECPDRIRTIWDKLQLAGVAQRCVVLGGSKAEDKHLQLVQTKNHVSLVRSISTRQFDSRRNRIASGLNSIYLNGGSSEAAYLSAGSVVQVAEKVAEGELDSAFAIVRPPGHHAEPDEAMGFCLFNNVAVATSYLLNERPDLGLKKILIVDWDVHHGNGTQKMFWKDPSVLCFSVHRHEHGSFYPGGDDGDYNMVGEGPGEGFNVNVPWEQGRCGDADYLAVWDHVLIPIVKEFSPDLILVSAGFDAAVGDPLGGCRITPYGYSVMLKKLMEFAKGKTVLALEGGYNLDSIAKSSLACVQVLLEDKPIEGSSEACPFESTWRVVKAVRKRLCAYWPSLADELPSTLVNQKIPTPIMFYSSSDSETEDDVHGIVDQVSIFNIENHQERQELENLAITSAEGVISPDNPTNVPSSPFVVMGEVNVGSVEDRPLKRRKGDEGNTVVEEGQNGGGEPFSLSFQYEGPRPLIESGADCLRLFRGISLKPSLQAEPSLDADDELAFQLLAKNVMHGIALTNNLVNSMHRKLEKSRGVGSSGSAEVNTGGVLAARQELNAEREKNARLAADLSNERERASNLEQELAELSSRNRASETGISSLNVTGGDLVKVPREGELVKASRELEVLRLECDELRRENLAVKTKNRELVTALDEARRLGRLRSNALKSSRCRSRRLLS